MAIIAEIEKGIGVHGLWKAHLKRAIETGKFDASIDTIRKDDHCDFGKWLYGSTLSDIDKASNSYKTVRDLHEEFHRTAAKIVDLALSGRKDEASKMISHNGEYALISSKLTAKMMEWKKSLT